MDTRASKSHCIVSVDVCALEPLGYAQFIVLDARDSLEWESQSLKLKQPYEIEAYRGTHLTISRLDHCRRLNVPSRRVELEPASKVAA